MTQDGVRGPQLGPRNRYHARSDFLHTWYLTSYRMVFVLQGHVVVGLRNGDSGERYMHSKSRQCYMSRAVCCQVYIQEIVMPDVHILDHIYTNENVNLKILCNQRIVETQQTLRRPPRHDSDEGAWNAGAASHLSGIRTDKLWSHATGVSCRDNVSSLKSGRDATCQGKSIVTVC